MKMVIIVLTLLFSYFVPVAHAAQPLDVVKRGDGASYQELIDVISRQFHGRIIRVELERDWLHWYYELRLLLDDGRIIGD